MTTASCFKIGRHHLSLPAVLGIFGSVSLLALCGLTLCLCVCCVRRKNRKAALPTKRTKKTTKQQPQEDLPQPQFIYQPLQQLQGSVFPVSQQQKVLTALSQVAILATMLSSIPTACS